MAIAINSILLDEGSWEWVYKGDDNKAYVSEANQFVGDQISWTREVQNFNPTDFGWADATTSHSIEDGIAIFFAKDSKYYRQYFNYEWVEGEGDLARASDSAVDISDRVYTLEVQKNIDIDQDGYEGTPPPVISKSLIAKDSNPGWGEAFYLTTDGELLGSQSNVQFSEGQVHTGQSFSYSDFSPTEFSISDLVARQGLDEIYFYNKSTGELYLQNFKEGNNWEIRETNGSPINVTSQIYSLEDIWGYDINLDGSIDEPPPTVEKLVFKDDYHGQSLYLLDDGSYSFNYNTNVNYEIGDEVESFREILKSSDFDLNNAIASGWVDSGSTLLFKLPSGGFAEQKFKENNSIYSASGTLKTIESDSETFYRWESDRMQDFNNDGTIGEEDTVIANVLLAYDDNYNHGIYETDKGDVIFTSQELEEGDSPTEWFRRLVNTNGDSFDFMNGAKTFKWENDGFAVIYKDENKYLMQSFKELDETANAMGTPKDITDKIAKYEDDLSYDINDDGIIGEEDAVITNVLLAYNNNYNHGIYETDKGDVIFSSEQLEQGDSPNDWFRALVDQNGDPFNFVKGAKAFKWVNKGFAVIYQDADKYLMQSFREGNDTATANGQARNVTSQIDQLEDEMGVDINADGDIGEPPLEVSKVLVNSPDFDQQGIYETSTGSIVLDNSDLVKGDILDRALEFLNKNGDPLSIDGELLAYQWSNRGISLIYESKNTFNLQAFKEINGTFILNGNARNITSKIERYEDDLAIDLNGDGNYGEASIEVSEVLFSGDDNNHPGGVYRTSTNSLIAAEPDLIEGDTPNWWVQIVDPDGDPFEPGDRLAGVGHARGGFSLIYEEDNKYLEQIFKETRDLARPSGKVKNVTQKIDKLEEELGIDLTQDGNYGEEAPVIQEVLFDGRQGYDWRGIYLLQSGELISSETDLSVDDTPNYYSSIVDADGDPFDTGDRVAAIRSARNGFSLIYLDGSKYFEQIFKDMGDFSRANGKPRNVTSKIKKYEDELDVDINLDNLFGDEAPSVLNIHFDGQEGDLDAGVYELASGDLISAESDLKQNDTPNEFFTFVAKNGDPFVMSGDPVGLISAKKGVGMVYREDSKFFLQQFKATQEYLREYGKAQNITKKIFNMEESEGIDFNGDGKYGKDAPSVDRIIYGGSDSNDLGIYQMDDGSVIVAESNLEQNSTPFDYIGRLLANSKNELAYTIDGEPLGVVESDGKYLIISKEGAKITSQQFKIVRDDLFADGRLTNITSKIENYEERYFVDFDQNGVIGADA